MNRDSVLKFFAGFFLVLAFGSLFAGCMTNNESNVPVNGGNSDDLNKQVDGVTEGPDSVEELNVEDVYEELDFEQEDKDVELGELI